mgnify:FL=1
MDASIFRTPSELVNVRASKKSVRKKSKFISFRKDIYKESRLKPNDWSNRKVLFLACECLKQVLVYGINNSPNLRQKFMTPRTLLLFLLSLFLGTINLFCKKLPFTQKPNIILVITDDQGYGPVGKHGHPWIKTPNLDVLHGQSTRFQSFLVSPTCSPTRAALMSGRHPMKNGITHTILERERMALSTVTLPQVLSKAGYVSGIFGKWHLGDEEPYQPHNRGFDEAFIHGAGGIGQAYKCSCADAPDYPT